MAKDIDTRMKSITRAQVKKGVKAGPGVMSRKLADFWKGQIEAVDEAQAKWIKRGNTISKRYRDERSRIDEEGQRRMNVLWTNIQIMKPAIYSKCPTAIVDRTFLDKDPTGRLSAQMLERSLRNEIGTSGTHNAINRSVLDYLLCGRGQVWARYEPEIGEGTSLPSESTTSVEDELEDILDGSNEITSDDDERSEDAETEQLEGSGDQVVAEKALLDYVDWHDFYMFPAKARTWEEVQAIGKRVYMSKTEAEEFFGEEIGAEITSDRSPRNDNRNSPYSDTAVFQDINDRNIVVVEIWNKTDRRVYWVSAGYPYLCKVLDDPLKLSTFFPCPKPLMATYTNDTVIPVPDFMEWQDQAIQIDELTQRIAMLSKACKIAGTYDASNGALKRLLNESVENELIPVDSWAMYAERGGVQGAISFLPIKEIQEVIQTLSQVRREVKQDLDEVTGLSDVLRGTTDSRETLGGLRLKNNNAGTRLSDRQNQVAEFARDAIKLQAEIVSKHFSDETIVQSSGIMFEEELQPDSIIAEIMTSDEFQQFMAQQQQMMQQQQLPPPQAPPQPQQGGNVVPFNAGQQPPQPQQGAPQPLMQGPQAPQMPSMDQIKEQLKPVAQEIAQDKISKSIALLRSDVPSRYRIDIETDSTIFADAMQERQDATEFITAVTNFLRGAQEVGQGLPQAMPLFGKMLQFGVRKFRTGRDLESSIDTFCKQVDKLSKDLIENPQPDPEQAKLQQELQIKQAEAEMQQKNDERDLARQQAEDQRTFQLQQADDQRKMQLEQHKANAQLEIEKLRADIEKQQLQLQASLAKLQHDQAVQHMQLENSYKQAEHERKMKELNTKDSMQKKKEAKSGASKV